ncbi:MAG TPA: TrmH family RNA methyltransferase [Salinimicrobium sp.]|nr:TrmH family RNA methyltransferase [Salinimicrobium sp.]
MLQLTHRESNFTEKKFPVILVLDGLTSPANIGSIFRFSDSFNIEKMIFCGFSPDLQSNRLRRTARSTLEKVSFGHEEKAVEACKELKKKGYNLVALEITDRSISVEDYPVTTGQKIALIIGNEKTGISEEVLKMAKQGIHITMFGKNSSMNVAQATGIALYEITKKLDRLNRNNIFTQ